MIVVPGNNIVYFDVDQTLLLFNQKCNPEMESIIVHVFNLKGPPFVNPYDWVEAYPHVRHIEQMRQHKARGHTVVVWSQGGVEWAEKAVRLLKIEHLVDVVMRKPCWYYDDKDASEFMGKPVYHQDKPHD